MSNEFIPVRLSHIVGQSGVGAIVRGADGLVVVQDTRQWTERNGEPAGKLIPYVERIRAVLGITQALREPPDAKLVKTKGQNKVQSDGTCLPATRFPTWMRCPSPSCGALYSRPWIDAKMDDPIRCSHEKCNKRPKLEQVTWVLAHEAGYLADVPWHSIAHHEASNPTQEHCKIYDQLRLTERGYEQWILHCDACKTSTIFRGTEHLPYGQKRMQPWTKDDNAPPIENNTDDPDNCKHNMAEILAIHDSRVYSPLAVTVLVIPPESRVRKGTVIDLLYRKSAERRNVDEAKNPLSRNSAIKALATKYRCQKTDIEAALAELDRGYPLYGENLTLGQLRESEFEAFLEILPDQREDEDLVTRNKSEEWHKFASINGINSEARSMALCVEHLVRVDRLKAVKVFRGFTRLDGENIVPPDIVGESDWLPAIELYGEGIFIALDENRLAKWEQQLAVHERLEKLQRRFVQSGRQEPNPLTPRFMLLHTLSHLLMRQIETEGGYPAASLIERIYCAQTPKRMAGILIHVAVPDIAGSLGGLAELAEPNRFFGILTRALEHAHWCSLDPVCSEHDGQGPGLLNRAACHACALVPEPACEFGNTLLDRGFIKGDGIDHLSAFFAGL